MDTNNLYIDEVCDSKNLLLNTLLQNYEAEFSNITKKTPNENGIFSLDTQLCHENRAFLIFQGKKPAGFLIAYISTLNKKREILEFYILPCYRRNHYGKYFSFWIFNEFKGKWSVKQLIEAKKAYCFWNKIISDYTKKNFTEDNYQDEYWGNVTRQTFNNE